MSSDLDRTALRRWGEKSGYREVLQQRPSSFSIKRFLLTKSRYPKLRNLALLCVWADAGVWAHWPHSLHRHLSSLGPASCIFSPPEFLSVHCREWLWLMATGLQVLFFLRVFVCASVAQSCLTLCDPMDCSSPGFSAHGILQARTLEWVAMPLSRGSSEVSRIADRLFPMWAIRDAPECS